MKNEKISQFFPCIDAMEWFLKQKNYKTAWENCERGDVSGLVEYITKSDRDSGRRNYHSFEIL